MKERRFSRRGGVEVRAAGEGQTSRLAGYAAVFGEISEDLGGFREIIEPGAFRACLAGGPDVRALFNHDPNRILGRTVAGTLTLAEDERGLRYEITTPDVAWARDLLVSIARGDISQSSFGFIVAEDQWGTQDGQPLRRIKAVGELFDVSPVTFPAYPGTEATARSVLEAAQPRIFPAPATGAGSGAPSRSMRRNRLLMREIMHRTGIGGEI